MNQNHLTSNRKVLHIYSRDVMKQGYCILEDMADPCRNVPQVILEKVQVPGQFPQHPLQDLYNAVEDSFQRGEYHKKEENGT